MILKYYPVKCLLNSLFLSKAIEKPANSKVFLFLATRVMPDVAMVAKISFSAYGILNKNGLLILFGIL